MHSLSVFLSVMRFIIDFYSLALIFFMKTFIIFNQNFLRNHVKHRLKMSLWSDVVNHRYFLHFYKKYLKSFSKRATKILISISWKNRWQVHMIVPFLGPIQLYIKCDRWWSNGPKIKNRGPQILLYFAVKYEYIIYQWERNTSSLF